MASLGLPQAYNYGFNPRELRDLRELIEANREQIEIVPLEVV